MKICQFNNVLYKGKINRDFYLYCLKKDIKLIRFIFINLWYYIISWIFSKNYNIYVIRRFRYLKYVKNLDKQLNNFYSNKKINEYFRLDPDIIVDKVPSIFIKNKFKNVKVIGYELDGNYDVKLDIYNKNISELKNVEYLYLFNIFFLKTVDSKNIFWVCNKRMKYLNKRYTINNKIIKFISFLILSLLLTCFSFFFTNSYLNMELFNSYFEIELFILNWVPIFLLMLLLLIITKRVHTSYLITSVLLLVWGVANQTKVYYRDDVVSFEDLRLMREALIMSEKVDIVIKKYTILFALTIFLLFCISRKKLKKIRINIKKQIILSVVLLAIMFGAYKFVYADDNIYDSVGDLSLVNRWIFTRQSQVRGLVYPFVHSIKYIFYEKPDNYDKKEAKSILEKYNYENIPNDKKVNVIAIMLEAYNDFSKFNVIDFNEDIYKDLHDIEDDSISGNLVVNIFGGGTVNTERSFLTGYMDFNGLRKKTNSYVWYFKEQGYRTEAMHPVYGAFYNRASINPNLGFDMYYNYENTFSEVQEDFVSDDIFFDYIISGYEKSKKDKVPYFNFSVTYQNHCPYSSDVYDDKEYYYDNVGYDTRGYNITNEYFTGIKKTNAALKELVEYFDEEDEPVIVVFFGDHNPALGEGDSIYRDLGVDLSFDTVNGFLNYYETPFVIHANDEARKMFNNDFVGDGGKISPIFLMNIIFNNMDLKGNEYLQYMEDLRQTVDVINDIYYKENGTFVKVQDNDYSDSISEYKRVSYYEINE